MTSRKFFTDKEKPTVKLVRNLINYAPNMDVGLSNWHEDPKQAMAAAAVAAYMNEPTMFDAVIAIRNDFYNDANAWAESMVRCGYDGFIHHLGLGVSHLMVYNRSLNL